jgi:uncharacterized membrane protein
VSILLSVVGVVFGWLGVWCCMPLSWLVSLLCSSVALALAIRDTNRHRGSKAGPRAIWYAAASYFVMALAVLGVWLSRY